MEKRRDIKDMKGPLQSLKHFLSEKQIKKDPQTLKTYGKDWLGYFPSRPSLVLFPESAKEVQDIVLWARQHKMKLVPSGGRTGLSGGATASKEEIVVSFERMNRILDFNPIRETLTCEAGVITEQVQKYAEEKGLYFPIHFSAQGSSQIGGNVATNAGGIKVVKYGLTRHWVLSLKVVTGEGEILQLGRSLVKNASGYDLKELFIGSEGTLGFIVEVTLKLTTKPLRTELLFFGFETLDSLLPIYRQMKKNFFLHSFEFMTHSALEKVLSPPFSYSLPLTKPLSFYLLIEVEMHSDQMEEKLFSIYESLDKKGLIRDGLMSQSSQQTKDLWSLRENISESLSPFSPYKNDISIPIDFIPKFIKSLEDLIQVHYPQFQVVWFGHIGDGNLHVNILKPSNMESGDFFKHCKKVDPLIFDLVQTLGGSISAEHGIGLLKKPFLSFCKSLSEIKLMKKIKAIFDPDGVMNPGKIWDEKEL